MIEKGKYSLKRHRAEKRFQIYGLLALGFALTMLALLLVSIALPAWDGFRQAHVKLSIASDEPVTRSNAGKLAKEALARAFPEVTERGEQRQLYYLLSSSAGQYVYTASQRAAPPFEVWVPASDKVDTYLKHGVAPDTPDYARPLSAEQTVWAEKLKIEGRLRVAFNKQFFLSGDSRKPEQAGILGAVVGSALTLMVCLAVSFPVGVMAAIWLEEFAPKGRLRDFIEVNINNLAAVPSIIYGLLGLAVWLNLLGIPRGAPLAGGLTLALLILPVIIIATRAALRAVPDSIRHGALALGASKLQVALHHTFPLAMPGIMTGTILGLARAIGETAPLLMIGMVAFVVDIPDGVTSAATALPVQVFLWASSPEAGFAGKTAAGIVVLLAVLLAMNALAIYLRKRYEIRW